MSACVPALVLVLTCVVSAQNASVLQGNNTLSQLSTPQLMNTVDMYDLSTGSLETQQICGSSGMKAS